MGEKMMAVEKENQVPDVEVTRYDITNMVYFIRNQQVMLDSDLAMLYQVETKNLNKAMKRNGQRFPKDFCFQLSKEEYDNLRFQIGTSSLEDNNYGGRRYLPYVYTEQGISMLASVLRSEVAINVSIGIMRAFVEMRRFIANNALLFDRISNIELKQLEYQKQTDEKLEQVLSKKGNAVAVTVYTQKRTKLTKADIENFNTQYPALEMRYTKAFHDRFLILDRRTAYHVGASLKDAGKKCFGINLIRDEGIIKDIIQRLELETEA